MASVGQYRGMSAKKSKDNRDTKSILFSVCQQLTSIPNSSLAIISSTCDLSLSLVQILEKERGAVNLSC